jgi:uncharacterized protein
VDILKIEVKVIPGARKRGIHLEQGRLKIKLLSKPIDGKANEELIDVLSDFLGVKRREVLILSGQKDTRKILSIPIDNEQFMQLFSAEGMV